MGIIPSYVLGQVDEEIYFYDNCNTTDNWYCHSDSAYLSDGEGIYYNIDSDSFDPLETTLEHPLIGDFELTLDLEVSGNDVIDCTGKEFRIRLYDDDLEVSKWTELFWNCADLNFNGITDPEYYFGIAQYDPYQGETGTWYTVFSSNQYQSISGTITLKRQGERFKLYVNDNLLCSVDQEISCNINAIDILINADYVEPEVSSWNPSISKIRDITLYRRTQTTSPNEKVRNLYLINDPETRKASWILEPVDAGTGAHLINKQLITVYGALPINFDTSYNSLMLSEGPMGKGWGHNYESNLQEQQDGTIKLYWTANRCNTFN